MFMATLLFSMLAVALAFNNLLQNPTSVRFYNNAGTAVAATNVNDMDITTFGTIAATAQTATSTL